MGRGKGSVRHKRVGQLPEVSYLVVVFNLPSKEKTQKMEPSVEVPPTLKWTQ